MKNLGFKNFNHKIFLKSFFHKKESQSDKLFNLISLFVFVCVPIGLLIGGNIIGTMFYLAYAYLLCFIIHSNKTIINGKIAYSEGRVNPIPLGKKITFKR